MNRQLDVWNYNMRIQTDFIRCAVVVYSNYVAECFTVSCSNPTALYFFRILNYVCDIVVKRFTFALCHLLMSSCYNYLSQKNYAILNFSLPLRIM